MSRDRRRVLAALAAVTAALCALVLFRVLGTVFLAASVAYVLAPAARRLEARGLSPWWTSLLAAVGALVGTLLLFVPFAIVLYFRRGSLIAFAGRLPDTVSVGVEPFVVPIALDDLRAAVVPNVSGVAVSLASSASILSVKLALFAFVVFGAVYHRRTLADAALAVTPPAYRDVLAALHEQVGTTLFGLYVVNVGNAVATYLLALALFLALDVRLPFVLALLAGLFRLLPVITPALLIGAVSLVYLLAGRPAFALLVAAGGAVLVVAAPALVFREWLGDVADPVPTTLYVVGLVGGVLTIGPVGLFAGPVAVALVVEAALLSARETAA